MNTDQQIKQFLVMLSDAFPGVAKTQTLQAYYSALCAPLKESNLDQVYKKLVNTSEFFPSIKAILDTVVVPKESAKDRAVVCVDRYILYLKGHLKYHEISGYDHEYCKKRFGGDMHAVQSGALDLNYRRKEWVEICEIDFEVFEKTGERPWGPRQEALPPKVTNLLQWGKDVEN